MEPRRHSFRAMGGPCQALLAHPDDAHLEHVFGLVEAEVLRLEARYSRFRDDSLCSALRARAGDPEGIEVDDETAALLDYASIAHRQSGGLFDPTAGVLREVWDFRSGRLPEPAAVEALLPRIGWHRLRWQRPRLVLPVPGMEIDFGGWVKEYAADRCVALCRAAGVGHGFVDLAGDLAFVGGRPAAGPGPGRGGWWVGIRDPAAPGRAMLSLPLRHGAIATSGSYERYMEVDGVRYSHLLDPRSGWPVRGLAGVSVVADRCIVAGSAATIAMLKGRAGIAWLAELGLPHCWVDDEGRRGGTLWPQERGALTRAA